MYYYLSLSILIWIFVTYTYIYDTSQLATCNLQTGNLQIFLFLRLDKLLFAANGKSSALSVFAIALCFISITCQSITVYNLINIIIIIINMGISSQLPNREPATCKRETHNSQISLFPKIRHIHRICILGESMSVIADYHCLSNGQGRVHGL